MFAVFWAMRGDRLCSSSLLSIANFGDGHREGEIGMKPLCLAFMILSLGGIATAEDVAYRKTKIADVKGKQANVNLIFSDTKKSIIVSVAAIPLRSSLRHNR